MGARPTAYACWCCRCGSPADPATVSRRTWCGSQVKGAGELQCPATNVNFSDRRTCGDGGRLTYRPYELDQREAVAVSDLTGDHGRTDPGDGEGPMSRARWTGRLAGCAGRRPSLAVAPVVATPAAPNPFGPRSTATTIVLNPDGSYDVTLRQTQQLVREYQITFGGGVHDGFRLPDDGALLPPYLRAGYALTCVSAADGQPEPADFTRTNHRVEATSHGTYPTGRHGFEISYRVTGAAQPTGAGWTVHVRLLDVVYSAGDRVEIRRPPPLPTGLSLRCVTYPPDSRAVRHPRRLDPDRRGRGRPGRPAPARVRDRGRGGQRRGDPRRRSTGANPRCGGGRGRRGAGRG